MTKTPVPRTCQLDSCDQDISHMRRGTKFCCPQHASQARYHEATADKPKGRRGPKPQGEHPKLSSALRQGRRIEAREYAELEAEAAAERQGQGLPPLPPWPHPDDEWRNFERYREMRLEALKARGYEPRREKSIEELIAQDARYRALNDLLDFKLSEPEEFAKLDPEVQAEVNDYQETLEMFEDWDDHQREEAEAAERRRKERYYG